MENKYGAFQQTTEDRKFMSMYYNSIIASRKFKENLKNGIKKPDPKHQEFEYEIMKNWDDYLIEAGRATPTKQMTADKWGLANMAFGFLQEDEDIEFKLLDSQKRIAGIKDGDTFYEVKVTRHKSPQVAEGEVVVAKKLNPFVEKLAEKLEEQYPVVVVKNNQITVEDDNKVHTSVKITKKKSRLF